MHSSRRTLLWGCALFSMFGLCTEIVFTGVAAGLDESLQGQVSLLMIPVYSFVYLAGVPALRWLSRAGLDRAALRIPLVVLAIYGVEWSSGAAYASVGLEPWRYAHGWASDFSGGHVTLLYLPAWVVFAALVVPVLRLVHAVAPRIEAACHGSGDSGTASSP